MSRPRGVVLWSGLVALVLCCLTVSTALAGQKVLLDVACGKELGQLQGRLEAPAQTEIDRWGPSSFRVMTDSRVVVADPLSHLVKVFGPGSRLTAALGDPKSALCAAIGDLAVTPDRHVVFVERATRTLVKMDLEGHVKVVLDPREGTPLEEPTRIECLADGGIVVGDESTGQLHLFGPDLKRLKVEPYGRMGMAVDPTGSLVTLRHEAGRVRILLHDRDLKARPGAFLQLPSPAAVHLEAAAGDELVLSEAIPMEKGHRVLWMSRDGRLLRSKAVAGAGTHVQIRATADRTVWLLATPAPARPDTRYRVEAIEPEATPGKPAKGR